MALLLPDRDAAVRAAAQLTTRSAGLFRRARYLGAPTRIEALAAVVVIGRGGRRESWSRSAELSEPELQRLTHNGRTPPAIASRSFQVVAEPASAIPLQCTNCMLRPGYGPCPRCIGTGKVPTVSDDEKERWSDCGCAGGFVRCTMCDGTRRMFRVEVHSVTETIRPFEEWVLPLAAKIATPALRSLGPAEQTEGFVCSLESPRVESAYRGAAAVVTPRFFDFELLDAAERARDRLAELHALLRPLEARAYAVPFFWLQCPLGMAVARRLPAGEYVAALCTPT